MKTLLHVKDLSAYYGKTKVISNINFPDIPKGKMVALLGRNSAGKSTLLKCLANQISYNGQVSINNKNLSNLSPQERITQIGYLPQTPVQASGLLVWEVALSTFRSTLPDLSNLEIEKRIQRIFDKLDLNEYAFRPIEELSGGKRQILGLALIIARETSLMLLDEPTSALDLRWQLETLTMVKDVVDKENTSAIIAMHDINLALRFCDDAIILNEGNVLAAGTSNAVITPDILKHVYQVQTRIEQCSLGHSIVLVDKPIH